MDEPSTGLDPASRNNLWSVVKEAKKNCAIILTSIQLSQLSSLEYFDRYIVNHNVYLLTAHSMEEAEVLCDRLGIFVDGGFQCITSPKEVIYLY
jgi:ABC-type multidrug transport system ATPase subunit